jgi:hypothetical protein
MRTWQILVLLGLAVLLGFTVFGILTSRHTTVERIPREEALLRMGEARALFGDEVPLLDAETAGRLVRRRLSPPPEGVRPELLVVLAYWASEERLVRVDVPFWFVKLKGPAAELALRDTGFDLRRLHMTASDLEELGPCLILDEGRANGDHVLVWTE